MKYLNLLVLSALVACGGEAPRQQSDDGIALDRPNRSSVQLAPDDSLVCSQCIIASITPRTDTTYQDVADTVITTRTDTLYASRADTVYRDSVVKKPPIVLPPPPPPTNQPAGLAFVAKHTFTQMVESGFTARATNLYRLVTDSSGSVGEAFYPAGFDGGRAPIQVGHTVSGTLLYVSFRLYMDPRWQGHPSGVNKILHFVLTPAGSGLGNKAYLSATGAGSGNLRAQMRLQGIAENPISQNVPAVQVIPRGQWVFVEALLQCNSAGRADGAAFAWLNGKLSGRDTSIAFTTSACSWTSVIWNPQWGGTGGTLSQSQVMRIDDLAIVAR